MKPLHVSEDILPLGEFRTHASKVLRGIRKTRRPVVITQHGRPAAVLIDPEEFDKYRERDRFIAAVNEGIADADAGRLVDDAELARRLDDRYGKLR